MEVGILGLPGVGKTSIFNALTNGTVAASQSAAKPNVGMAQVPDERLARINALIETKRVVPATVKFVDIAGLAKGASKGEGLGNRFLSYIREADAILEVVRCFDNPEVPHIEGSVDPVRDVETIEMEMVLADLETLEKNIEKQRKHARSGDKEAILGVATLEQVIPELQRGTPIRKQQLKPEQLKTIRVLGLLSDKRVLHIANVAENDIQGTGALAAKLRQHVESSGGGEIVPVCAKLESELVQLPAEDRTAMLADYGMTEPALTSVTKAAYRLLGLQSFFTVGPDEIRAWPIPVGAHAPQAAGVIHTDFEKGFIRAEIYNFNDLMELKSESAIKHAGRMRAEGKTYIMREGDIAHFLFSA